MWDYNALFSFIVIASVNSFDRRAVIRSVYSSVVHDRSVNHTKKKQTNSTLLFGKQSCVYVSQELDSLLYSLKLFWSTTLNSFGISTCLLCWEWETVTRISKTLAHFIFIYFLRASIKLNDEFCVLLVLD